MNRRLFIAIDLPQEIKEVIRHEIDRDKEKTPDLYTMGRMVAEENWHITLLFLGDQPEEKIPEITGVIRELVANSPTPAITIRTLTTAPPHRPPRMIWATTTTETNQLLGAIKQSIEEGLVKRHILPGGEKHPTYNGHITLTRLAEGMRIADHFVVLPNALAFTPKTIDLMETHLDNTGARYTLVESIKLEKSQ